jgi:hypothetical protein
MSRLTLLFLGCLGLALVARNLAVDGAILTARDPLRDSNTPVRIVPPKQRCSARRATTCAASARSRM